MTHDLKIWPEYFEAIRTGIKTFELRVKDRDYRVGDTLLLREWNPKTHDYTGRTATVEVTYMLDNPRILEHQVVMSIRLVEEMKP